MRYAGTFAFTPISDNANIAICNESTATMGDVCNKRTVTMNSICNESTPTTTGVTFPDLG